MSEAALAIVDTPKDLERPPLVTNHRSLAWITNNVSAICEGRTPIWWWIAFLLMAPLASVGLFCIGYQISNGVGVWGENHPNGWAWDITNFVFWIGIGHAGTLISAILFLTRQKWRTSINRSAEAMTLFAVICAGIFPGIHVGRVWMAWFLAPVPNDIRHLAELPLAAAVGRLRGLDLLHRLGPLLVHRPRARSRDPARPREVPRRPVHLRHLRPRLARLQPQLAALRDGLPHPGRPLHAAGAVGPLGRLLRLRHVDSPRLAHHHLPALLRRRRHLRRLRHGAHHPDAGEPASIRSSRTCSRAITWTRWPRSSCSPAASSATPTSWSCSSPTTAGTSSKGSPSSRRASAIRSTSSASASRARATTTGRTTA